MAGFPKQQAGIQYLTEGGQETEVMYRHGYELPEFALFSLLDRPDGLAALTEMYRSYLQTAVDSGFVPLMGGLDYRASPDWAGLLGHGPGDILGLEERCMGFLHDVAEPFSGLVPDILFAGIVGPRGDAYTSKGAWSADEAAEYHGLQIRAMKSCGVDLVEAMTFNNVAEAVGVSRAATDVGLPVAVLFTLDSDHRLHSGVSLREAIDMVDSEAGEARPDFFGINCSHPLEFEPTLEAGEWIERIRIVRPNASSMDKVALCQIGHLEEGNPPELGEQLGDLARRFPHIDIWGGCCGTWSAHLREIAQNVGAAG